jgi:hypothetical protein
MLKEIIGNNMTVICNNCKTETIHDLSGITARFSPEFGEYENLSFLCPGCQSIESFNMNIPVDDTDEPFMTGDLPVDEETQRYYVRILMRIAREDLQPKNEEGIT